ncbi:ABC transporter ATP-binding protein [Deinococcus sp.]|uniref:ABC transporter ATP-binding protein n=1 Tax=Deinococcus sp. TaxID=47478 RepID=UPI00286E3446|nr:ABC transporter ATP-binding protein [Deinococcus sp.]
MAEIRLEHLHKRFTDFVAVHDSTLTIAGGEFLVLLGPSGCGKTTTLRMIAGLELPTSGQILLGGEDVTFRRARERDIAFVFQMFALYPHMTVRQNISFPLLNERVSKQETQRRVGEIARMLQIEHLLARKVTGLSGGDRQRVALGRAIVRKPKAFLMDEPLGTLDAEFREQMCLELRQLHDRLGATTVYVTHDQSEAMAMADKIVVMDQGRILQADTPDRLYDCPSCVFVGRFIGAPPMSFLTGGAAVRAGDRHLLVDDVPVAVPEQYAACEEALLGLRPERVSISSAGGLRGEVMSAEYLGSHQIVTVQTRAGVARARVDKGLPVRLGESVGLTFEPDSLILYDARTEQRLPSAYTRAFEGQPAFRLCPGHTARQSDVDAARQGQCRSGTLW